jgi:putative flippase GtrA
MSKALFTRSGLLAFASQLGKFGAVGLVGFAVDVTVFNLLRTTILDSDEVHAGPIYAKVISTLLAILVNWIGNRLWTFSANRQDHTVREGLEFFAVSLVGMGIGLACLWVSHYVLGFTSVLADNISGNVIGLALGAVFRFSLYRWWVFAPHRRNAGGSAGSAAGAAPASSSIGATCALTSGTVTTETLAAVRD